jgi:uncharacterized protein (DUF1501 family)
MLSGLSKFGLVSALAQGTTDYKALVCIFMFGGNDGNNMLVPIDARYAGYQQVRGGLALPQVQLLPLQSGGQSIYGLHPNMPEMQGYFNNQKNLALLANVGTLVQPTTQTAYKAYSNLPQNLYSHSDQQDQWQSAQLAGTPLSGWAGKVADAVESSYNRAALFPPILSVSGSPIFLHRHQFAPVRNESRANPRARGIRFFGSIAGAVCRDPAVVDLRQRLEHGASSKLSDRTSRAIRRSAFRCAEKCSGFADKIPEQLFSAATRTGGASDRSA